MNKDIQKQLEKLFLSHYDQWCMFSYSYTECIVEAEEVVQDVCANILLREKEPEILNLQAYIHRAIRNRSIGRLKQLKKFETISETDIQTSQSFEEDLISEEKKMFILNAVESLPEPCKKVFILCVIEGYKYKNVANIMGISVNTVKYHIKNAYKQLRLTSIEAYFFTLIFTEFLFY